MAIIELRNVSKSFPTPAGPFFALRDVSLDIERGALTAVVGASGSGKSTLLALLAGIDRADGGSIRVDDTDVGGLSERALSAWRGRAVGVVFQFFQLLPTLTALENVMLPMDFCRTFPSRERAGRALGLLERLGVPEQAHKLPQQLSGGQQQRVAIARALANEPALLLADEPTGNLDSKNADAILALFADLASQGQTVVLVTHEREAVRRAARTITIVDGRV